MSSQTNGYLACQTSYQDLINRFTVEYPIHFSEVLKFNSFAGVWYAKTKFYSRNRRAVDALTQTQLRAGVEQINSYLKRFQNAMLRAFSHLELYLNELPRLRNAGSHLQYGVWLRNLERNPAKIHDICQIWCENYGNGVIQGQALRSIYSQALQELKHPPESIICPVSANHFEWKSL